MQEKIILTLDAGGTNFVFSAMQDYEEITDSISLPSNAHDLELCLTTIVNGFEKIIAKLNQSPSAISFAFPGPADYRNGIIGDLNNLPAFKGGIALGPMLEEKFNIPVFINNDGDLFALGEAINGIVPFINNKLKEAGVNKRYRNLIGVTLGTGFGAGIVINGNLLLGDNSNAAEVWLMRDGIDCNLNAEENISIRAVKRNYAEAAGIDFEEAPEPKDIFRIAKEELEGNVSAAKLSFEMMGKSLGEALANMATLIDGLVVIGGGISNAYQLFMPSLIRQMNSTYHLAAGNSLPRLVQKVFPLTCEAEINRFCNMDSIEVVIPFSNRKVHYNKSKRIGVGITKLGTSKAVAVGAYSFAIQKLAEK